MADPHRLSPSGKFLPPGGTVQVAAVQASDGPIQDTAPIVALDGSTILVTGLEAGEELLFRYNIGWMQSGNDLDTLEVQFGTWDGATFEPFAFFAPFSGFPLPGFTTNMNFSFEKFMQVGTDFPLPFQIPPGTYTFAVGMLAPGDTGAELRLSTFSITRFRP